MRRRWWASNRFSVTSSGPTGGTFQRQIGVRDLTFFSSPQQVFGAAEQAFVEGRLTDARSALLTLDRLGLKHPSVFHLRALVEQQLGNHAESQKAFAAATRLAPQDPQIANNLGNLFSDMGEEAKALEAYERALSLSRDFPEAALNRALALLNLGRRKEARVSLSTLESSQAGNPRYWNAVGTLEREEENLGAAAEAFDRTLKLRPDDPFAKKARARIALDRGEPDAVQLYSAARSIIPDDPQLILEHVQARVAEGDVGALDDLQLRVRADPGWVEGQITHAKLRWEVGEMDAFDAALDEIACRAEQQPELWEPAINLLAECARHSEAAEMAKAARRAQGDQPVLLLYEGAQASRAGDQERALTLYRRLPRDLPGSALREANCRARLGEIDQALALIDIALAEDDSNVAAWALAEIIYRAAQDPRSDWLTRQPGLLAFLEIDLPPERLAALRRLLVTLHENSTICAGKSVRHGTQTRGLLFNRTEPELAELKGAIEHAIARYVRDLPPADPGHPLLRWRSSLMKIAGSWSVRLTGAGRHISHYHPEGLISSACYISVPDTVAKTEEGWLELGRAPSEFGFDLEPLATIMPRPGWMALFPSYLHHGTRPFSSGERLTVAFDVVPA
jgi:tetratricopeptide (TPR) repeat protein